MSIRAAKLHTQQAYNLSFRDLMLTKRTALPGIIQVVNYKNGKLISVDVQPAIRAMLSSDDNYSSTHENLPIIPDVPIVIPYSNVNGFSLTVPIAIGDECLLIICDRSIDNWQNSGGIQSVVEDTTPRSHDLTDAICIIGAISEPNAITDYSTSKISLRNKDNTVSVSLDNDSVALTKNTSAITIEDNDMTLSVGSSSISITDDTITLKADTIVLNGAVETTSSFEVGGEMTDKNGISVNAHVHNDPQGGETGAPKNP